MFGLRITPLTVVWSSILAMIAVMAGNGIHGVWGKVLMSSAIIGAIAVFITVHGESGVQWAIRRWRVRDGLKYARMVDAKGRAMVWDGKAASMFIEIFGDQWAVSTVDSDGTTTSQKIPMEELRTELRQFDIVVNHIRIIEYGYKYASFDRASMSVAELLEQLHISLEGAHFLRYLLI